jgi:hypothetical protein
MGGVHVAVNDPAPGVNVPPTEPSVHVAVLASPEREPPSELVLVP